MKRHTLFIYIAALLTMLGTALPMSAQNKSFTVNRNDGASQKYSYSQGDRLVLSREDSQGKKYADFVEQQVYVGNAVHNIPLTSIESITFDAQVTLEVEPNTPQKFGVDGGTKTFTVTTNQPKWGVSKNGDWFNYSTSENILTVTAEPNDTWSEREGYLEIYALNEKNEKVSDPVYIKVTQKGRLVQDIDVQGVTLSVTAYGYDGVIEYDCGRIHRTWSNDDNKTEIILHYEDENQIVHVECNGAAGTLTFTIGAMVESYLRRGISYVRDIKASGDGWTFVSEGSSGNRYEDNENTITGIWDVGKIIEIDSRGITKIGRMEYEGALYVTFK